jgi:Xaa-Pro dipeptidase
MMPELRGTNQPQNTVVLVSPVADNSAMTWLDESRLAALYPAHLQTQSERASLALANRGFERLVIFAGRERVAFRDDTAYPFVANPYFKAFLPLCRHPDCALVLAPARKPELIYMQPRDYWHMAPAYPQGYWADHFQVRIVAEPAQLDAALPEDLSTTAAIGEGIHTPARFAAVNDTALLNMLDYQRASKTPYEIECIAAANRRAAPAHQAARSAFFAGASEFGIHQAYCGAAQHTDHELPYGNIIALNEHAAVLHYQHLDREAPPEFRSFLIDAGAACQGYAADITRTWSSDTTFQELIGAMERLQQSLCLAMVAGAEFTVLHDQAHQGLARVLVEADIARGRPDDVYARGITRYFLPHGLGHLLGLQVHDAGGHLVDAAGNAAPPPEHYPWLRLTRRLEPGFVVTVEPGLYFIDLLLNELAADQAAEHINWRRVEELKPFGGIRIEDNIAVATVGPRNLTREAFAAARA